MTIVSSKLGLRRVRFLDAGDFDRLRDFFCPVCSILDIFEAMKVTFRGPANAALRVFLSNTLYRPIKRTHFKQTLEGLTAMDQRQGS